MSNYTVSVKFKASTSDFQNKMSAVSKQFQATSAKVGSLGSKFQTVGKNLTNKITKPAGIAAVALGAIPLVKGWNRLVGIDNAKAKLEGLGFSAKQVSGIMDSALDSVKGTAYGLDEAATSAASAVAAGVKPGKELTKYLGTVGDAAAIAGISMGEMGSIFGKVQTSQKAYTMELNQLADKGLPIYQWLADEAGVTADEIKKMASEGKISSEMFLKAIDKNIGGAAKIMGQKSFSGAVANIGASIGRIGANFLDAGGQGGGFFSQLKPLMADFNEKLGTVEDKAAEFGVAFGKAFAKAVTKVKELKAKWDGLSPGVKKLITNIILFGSGFAVAIGPVIQIVGTLMVGFSKLVAILNTFKAVTGVIKGFGVAIRVSMLGPFLPIAAVIGAVVAALAYLWKTDEGFRKSITESGNTIKNALMPVLNALKEAFKAIGPAISQLVKVLAPIIAKIVSIVGTVIAFIVSIVANLVKNISEKFQAIWTKIKAVVDKIKSAWSALKTSLTNIVTSIRDGITSRFTKAKDKVVAVVNSIKSKWQALKTSISNIVTSIRDGIVKKFNYAKDRVVGVINRIKSAWTGVKNVASGIATGVSNAFSSLVSKVKGYYNSFARGINWGIGKINAIPGVNVKSLPYLLHGTDNWQGGFAVMNEGGRGELVNLPNGSQVIPHDISTKYAKESARVSGQSTQSIDYNRLITGIAEAMSGVTVEHSTTLDGKTVAKGLAPLIDRQNGRRAVLAGMGV